MSVSYLYDVATQTAAGAVNVPILQAEIEATGLGGGGNPLEAITVDGGSVGDAGVISTPPPASMTITFASALTPGEETTLDAVVAAHTAPSFAPPMQMVESPALLSTAAGPVDKIDFTSGPLMPGQYLIQGCGETQLQAAVAGSMVRASIALDGATILEDTWGTNDWHSFVSIMAVNFIAGATPRIQLQLERTGPANTADMRRAILTLKLL